MGFMLRLILLSCGLTASTDKVQIKRIALLIVGEMGHTCTLTPSTRTCTPGSSKCVCVCDQVCIMERPLSVCLVGQDVLAAFFLKGLTMRP